MRFNVIALTTLAAAQQKSHSEPVYSCDAGFFLRGKECVQQTAEPAEFLCLEGKMQNGVCVAPGGDESFCPNGTQDVNGQCQSREETMPVRQCPPNTHDIGGECMTYAVSGIIERCEVGELEGGECAIYEPVAPIKSTGCPLGYTPAKGSCWKSAAMDCTPPHEGKRRLQEYVPEAKLHVTQKKCEVKLEAEPMSSLQCPAGAFERNGQCVIRSAEPTKIACSAGEDYLCFPSTAVPAFPVCPAGFALQGDVCERTNIASKITQCDADSVPGPNGECIKFLAPPQPKCPAGKQLAGNMCLGEITAPPHVEVVVNCTGKDCYH